MLPLHGTRKPNIIVYENLNVTTVQEEIRRYSAKHRARLICHLSRAVKLQDKASQNHQFINR